MIEFRELEETHIEKLFPIMKDAFDNDTKIHLNKEKGGPTGYDDGSFLKHWGLDENSTAYCIYYENILIGAVILWINSNKKNYLGSLFIDPKYENKGLGIKIWNKIESIYPDTKVWNAETPLYSHRNHNFYVNKCGFHIIKINNPKDLENGSYTLEKIIWANFKDL